MSVVLKEVSERKMAEEFNSVLLEYSPNPIKVCYPDLSIAYINPALENITGYSKQELIGRKLSYPYWGKQDFEQYERNLRKSIYSDASILERQLNRKNGEPFDVETNVSLVKQGDVTKLIIFNWTDITARKNAVQLSSSMEQNNIC
jgi:PAS domain S-box-containing protein